MKRLVFYELKKSLGWKKAVLFVLIGLTCSVTMFLVFSNDYCRGRSIDEIKTRENYMQGEMTAEKKAAALDEYERIINNPDSYSDEKHVIEEADYMLLPEAKEKIEKIYQYTSQYGSFDQNEYRNELLNEQNLSKHRKLLIQKELSIFDANKETPLVSGYCMFYEIMITYMSFVVPILIGFIIIFLLSPIFSSEYQTNTISITHPTEEGRRGMIFAKIISSILIITFFLALTIGSYATLCAMKFGLEGANVSFMLKNRDPSVFYATPYRFSMIQYMGIILLFLYLGIIGFIAFVFFISSITSNSIITMSITTVYLYAPLFALLTDSGYRLFPLLCWFPAAFMSPAAFFMKFNGIVVLGNVFSLNNLSLILLLLITFMFFFLSYKLFKNKQVLN